MFEQDWLALMAVGGLFILLGLISFFWGKHEQSNYDRSLLTHMDKREFFEHWPARPEPGALKIGGWIAIAIGLVMIAMGTVFMLRS
ncbi:MAG: hypothetical protein ABIH70_00310 [Chloroflexota bacterium]